MDAYPNSEDEFELQYGDDLQVLNELDVPDDTVVKHVAVPTVRKSLDFTTPKSKVKEPVKATISQEPVACSSKQADVLDNSFDRDFQRLENQTNVISKKRAVENLFGDIDDLIMEEHNFRQLKKPKTEDEKLADNLALIDCILERRQLFKDKHNPNLSIGNTSVSSVQYIKNNISFRVPKYPFIALTTHDGERIYARMHSEDYEQEDIRRIMSDNSFTGLLGNASKELWEKANVILNQQLTLQECEEARMDVTETDDSKLWVDMYKPRKYTELLSDESTNRTLLKWIKLWDKVVFRRRPKVKSDKHKSIGYEANPNFKKFFQKKELDLTLDEHHRPKNKVALLCGSPGLGKTTLAHMVAKHAGYNVVEINASDDRDVDSFKTALTNATQMKSVLDTEGRPNCLVFDEIDGAPVASIEYLVKYINGTLVNKSKKGKKEKPQILKRPIICICNDLYVPSLRSLRQIAFILNFPPIACGRLAGRLMEISRWQGINTDLGAMMALSEKTNNDIRSCLSILHFFKAKNIRVSITEVNKASIGQKDIQKGLFSVWQDMFETKRNNNGEDIPLCVRSKTILNTVITFGNYDRLILGIFENYPQINQKREQFPPVCTAVEWFSYTDCMNKNIQETQNYSMNAYIPYGFVVWHFALATYGKKKINYPYASYEVTTKTNKQSAIIHELLRGFPPTLRPFTSANNLRLDIIPLFSEILAPNLRTMNLSFYAPEEKRLINHTVNVMIDYNLTYVQERTTEGSYVFFLEPNIEDLMTFEGLKLQKKILSYGNKQTIAREIEFEKMRRVEESAIKHTEKMSAIKEATQKKDEDKNHVEKNEDIENVVPNHLQRLKPKNVAFRPKEVIVKDFFGRIISKPAKPKFGDQSIGGSVGDIWYQYKEGYNNAVKRKIKINYLL